MIRGKRAFLAKLMFNSSAFRYLKLFEAKNLVIFNYHRIRSNDGAECPFDEGVYGPTESELREQLTWLKANTNIISEIDLINHVHHQVELPHSSTMVTFDDGYLDNAELALPLLKELKIPAIFFISTQAIEERGLGWWDNIAYLIKNSIKDSILVQGQAFNLVGRKPEVIRELQEWMRTHRTETTVTLVKEIAETCGVPMAEVDVSSRELMSWEQIKEAQDAGMTIGSHTHTHRVLSTLSRAEQLEEFLISKQILEAKLKTRIRSVAYPVGGYEDCHLETGGLAEQSGYELGFSFQTGFNPLSEISPFNVRRISSEEGIPLTCAAVTLPTIFARSRTGERLTRSLTCFTHPLNDKEKRISLKTRAPSYIGQSSLWMIIISLILGPSYPKAAAAENSREETHAASTDTENTITEDDSNDDSAANTNANTVIEPGFKIHLTCPDDAKINGDFRVSWDGEVSLPYQVSVKASGLKVKSLQAKLEKTYRQYFKGQPRIHVSIKQKRYAIKVVGVVKNPGIYLLKEHTTVDEALAMAQVRTEDVSTGFVRVGSGNHGKWISMDDYMKGGPARDLPSWKGGEQLLFQLERPEGDAKSATSEEVAMSPSERKIEVLGEVKNPGAASFQRHADGYYYLIQRGGPTQFSDLTQVEVVRKDPLTNEHKQISLGDLKDVRDIHESDVIIFHPDRPTSVERGLTTAGIVAGILSAIVLTIFVVRNK